MLATILMIGVFVLLAPVLLPIAIMIVWVPIGIVLARLSGAP